MFKRKYKEHNGTCGFCHSAVSPKAEVCTSCHSHWRQVHGIVINIVVLFGLVALPSMWLLLFGLLRGHWSDGYINLILISGGWIAAMLTAWYKEPWRWTRRV